MKNRSLTLLLVVATCLSMILSSISILAANETVTVVAQYDSMSKTVNISGTANAPQVEIKITLDGGSATPVYYEFANVTDSKYNKVVTATGYAVGTYTVRVKNMDDNSVTTISFSTADNSAEITALNTIKGYADSNNSSALTIKLLKDAGVTGTVDAYLNAYKSKIASLTGADIDNLTKLQNVINTVNAAEQASQSDSVTVKVIYNLANKTASISGTAKCPQVQLKITKNGESNPVYFGGVNVTAESYSITIPTSTYTAGQYNVEVTNPDTNVKVIDKFTVPVADTTPPVITIGDYIKTPTNKSITVTATTNEGTLNKNSHTFDTNGNFEFVATDAAGNTSKVIVTITNIDKTAPVITLGNYITTPTNKDIVVTATTNEGTLNKTSHTFTANGNFEFVATDAAGNVSKMVVTITNIDKTAPVITIADYNKETTSKAIVVTASTNEGTLNAQSHTFTENGSFDFVATDAAGNTTTVTVKITNIIKETSEAPIESKIESQIESQDTNSSVSESNPGTGNNFKSIICWLILFVIATPLAFIMNKRIRN